MLTPSSTDQFIQLLNCRRFSRGAVMSFSTCLLTGFHDQRNVGNRNLVIDRGFLEGLVWYLSFQSRGGLHTALWICWRSIWRWGSDGEHRLSDRRLTCCLCLVFCLWNSWPTCYNLIADAGSLRMDAVGVRGWSCCMVPQWVSEIIKPTVKHI